MNRLHIQLLLSKWMLTSKRHQDDLDEILLSKWTLTLARHRAELNQIEREMTEYAARLNQPQLPIEQESVE